MTSIRKFTEFVQDSQAQENGALNSADDRQGDRDGSDAHRCSSFDGIVGGSAKAIPQSGFPSSGETVTDESGVKGTGRNDDQFKEGRAMTNEQGSEFRMVPVEFLHAVDRVANMASDLSPCIDAVEEAGGEEADDPMWAIHHILYHARFLLAAAPTPPKSEHGPIQWTPGPNVFKDWCSQYFGPDSDDTYLAEAVFNLPPMAQKFKYSEPRWPDGTPKAFDNYEHDKRFAEESPSIPFDRNAVIEECAKWFDKKADDFAREYGSDDMGGLSFGVGDHAEAKREYHNWLLESAEELRSMKSQPAPAPTDDGAVATVFSSLGRDSYGKYRSEIVSDEPIAYGKRLFDRPAPCARCAEFRRTAEYWKAEHLAGNERIAALEAENARLIEKLDAAIKTQNDLDDQIKAWIVYRETSQSTIAQQAEALEAVSGIVEKAIRRSFDLGQTYWQQADSEYVSQNKKSDETYAKFQAVLADALAKIAALLKPGEKTDDWRPIETAPKDGSPIVVGFGRQSNFPVKIVQYDVTKKLWMSYGEWEPGLEANATHWIPLPPAPKTEKTDGEAA